MTALYDDAGLGPDLWCGTRMRCASQVWPDTATEWATVTVLPVGLSWSTTQPRTLYTGASVADAESLAEWWRRTGHREPVEVTWGRRRNDGTWETGGDAGVAA